MKRVILVGVMTVALVVVLVTAMEVSAEPLAAHSGTDVVAASTGDSQLAPLSPTQLGTVTMRFAPSPYTATVGEIFIVDVEVVAGTKEVKGTKMYLDFDTSKLMVVDEAGHPTDEIIDGDLDVTVKNEVDNDTGQIAYDTAMLGVGNWITGTFTAARIRFKALELGTGLVTISTTDPRKTRVSYLSEQDYDLIASDGVINIVPGVAANITLTPQSQMLSAGYTATLTATVTNQFDRPWLGDVTFEASAGCIDSPVATVFGAAATSFDCITQAQTVLITGTAGSVTDTAEVVVTADEESLVSVRIVPKDVTLAAGACVTFTLLGEDIYGNEFDVTARSAFTATGGGTLTENVYCAEVVGEWMVTGEYEDESDDAAVTVEPDRENPVSVTIAPKATTLTAGACVTFTLTGEDAYGHTFDVTDDEDTVFSVSGPDDMDGNEYCSRTAGEWTVTGEYLGKSDDAVVTVQAGTDITSLAIGHIDDQTVHLAFTIVITAYNGYGNVARYDGTAILSDTTGTLAPTVVTFTNGLATPEVVITTPWDDVVIAAKAGTETAQSNAFDVRPWRSRLPIIFRHYIGYKPHQILLPIAMKDFIVYEPHQILLPVVFRDYEG